MKKLLLYLIALIIVSFTFLIQTMAQDGIIKGRVKDNEDILPAATVTVGKKTVITNNAGEFLIRLIPGTYTVVISYTGYQSLRKEIIIKAGETIELDFTLAKADQLNEIRIIGSRSNNQRSNMSSPVPVDIISSGKLPRAETDLTQQLFLLIPSFNSPPQTVGGSAHTNPATLRGLSTDQALVLINGRRRHTATIIFTQYSLGYGSVGTDLNAIPAAAIENIQVLRDGASAQYGSDAIAGAMDLQLTKSTGTTRANLHLGQFYKRDGETISFDINHGFRLNKKGYLNFTFAYRFSNPTQRNGPYDSTVYYPFPANATPRQKDSVIKLDNEQIAARGFDRLNHRPIGLPQISNTSFIINGGYPLKKKTNLFWTGTFHYRYPVDRGSNAYRYPKDTSTVITSLYEDGFIPTINSVSLNASLIAGIEGETIKGWHWDFSSVFGGNISHTDVSNSNNASQNAMGKNAQTVFDIGNVSFTQNTNNANITRNYKNLFRGISSFTTSFGGEFRIDQYRIKKGEEASWKDYAPGSPRQWGSQGLAGYSDSNVVNKSRYISAAYTELEMETNDKWLFNIATRYEYYSDFGGNLAGKLALRYKLSDKLILRGSLSNGFRAPAIQQRYYSTTSPVTVRGLISITEAFRNDSKTAEAFGISPLEAERSLTLSGGLTSKISPHINITLDAYWVQISNRIILTGQILRSSSKWVDSILNSLGKKGINAIRFMTNAVSTRTKGIDLVATGIWPIRKSNLEISLSGNYNETMIYRISQPAKNLPDDSLHQYTLINPEERGRLEQAQPLCKIIGAANYKTGKWEFVVRSIYFGKAAHIFTGAERSRDEFFSPKVLCGFSLGYSPKQCVTIKAGVRNVFNTYPDKIKHRANTNAGQYIYDFNGTQIGYNGGYYFVNMAFSF